ncbi:diphosphomevalonate decarboxylase [Balneatrix alpica]|uniref:diphosphomevalonate decarboxylase n=1 Tax=Balneatrix alpica TaxID=75684 RepID=UPI002738464A|nr:diphosphomevalonate decarboxylase [Balneatrix alpica]
MIAIEQAAALYLQQQALQPQQSQASAFAPSNIALCKYWGKRQAALNLPMNASLSLSLGELGTHTQVRVAEAKEDQVILNGRRLAADSRFATKVSQFIDLFRGPQGQALLVDTRNTIPTAAGLASSASGFAALTLALSRLYGLQLPYSHLSAMARLGSGSACRSLFQGLVEWHAGEREDGLDSYAEPLQWHWPELRLGVLALTQEEKKVDSRAGMNRTTDTCLLYQQWPAQAARDLRLLKQAFAERDLKLLGETAEHNALSMHATMIATWPPLLYWLPESVAAMQQVWQARAEGLALYFTMDAGPNLKLIFSQQQQPQVQALFPQLQVVIPGDGPNPLV